MAAGEPVWWRVDPGRLAPGEVGEAVVRLRAAPTVDGVTLEAVADQGVVRAVVPVVGRTVRLAGICVGPERRRAWLFLRGPVVAPLAVRVDGVDLVDGVDGAGEVDAELGMAAVEVRLAAPLDRGSYHCFRVVGAAGQATAGLRVWGEEPCSGIWGARPGREGDTALAQDHLRDIHDHLINVQMEMVGSAAVREYQKSDVGRAFHEGLGLQRMVGEPGKGGTRRAFANFLVDEPDVADYRVEGVPLARRVGSMGQALLERAAQFRAADPETPQLLNVDVTLKPDNWRIYGQLPDILAADPYYQERLRSACFSHPERLPLTLPRHVWARALLAGRDSMLLVVVNDDYANDRVGTVWQPVEAVKVGVRLPSWLAPQAAFEITSAGTREVDWTRDGATASVELGKLDLTRLVVLTADAGLQGRLQARYQAEFAVRADRLRREP